MTARRLRVGDESVEVEARLAAGRLECSVGSDAHAFQAVPLGGPEWLLTDGDGRSQVVFVVRRGPSWWIHAQGRAHLIEEAPEGARGARGAPAGGLTAPMTATVAEVLVKVGDRVKAGAPLLVLSAMKMQVEIKAPMAGVVRQLLAGRGDRVEGGTVLAVVEPTDAGSAAPAAP